MLKLEIHTTKETYAYDAGDNGTVYIHFLKGEFDRVAYDFGTDDYSLAQWRLLAEIHMRIELIINEKAAEKDILK